MAGCYDCLRPGGELDKSCPDYMTRRCHGFGWKLDSNPEIEIRVTTFSPVEGLTNGGIGDKLAQTIIYYDNGTVREHTIFDARLKGLII